MQVIKRNGQKVDFNPNKIQIALTKANSKVSDENKLDELKLTYITDCVVERIKNKDTITVEEIQDEVEKELVSNNAYYVAKEYITYRQLHNISRENYEALMSEIAEKLSATNVQNQNANMDEHSFGGRMGEANSVVMKQFALNYRMSKMARENHLNNIIYTHDLDSYELGMHNCLTIPYDKLLKNGFDTRNSDIRPAQSINSAFQLIAVLMQLQSLQQFGKILCRSKTL